MRDLAKTAKRYCLKASESSYDRETADLVLDLLQAWATVFMPFSSEYPFLARIYQELKREGLPFKASVDLSKAPTINVSKQDKRERDKDINRQRN